MFLNRTNKMTFFLNEGKVTKMHLVSDEIFPRRKKLYLLLNIKFCFKVGRKLFFIFLQHEHSDENLQFWNDVNKMKRLTDDPIQQGLRMRTIYNDYIKPLATKEVFCSVFMIEIPVNTSYSSCKGKERTTILLFKYLLQLMLYMLYILVDDGLLNSALLI